MGKITLDPELKKKLNGLNEQVEVCDETGKTVGHFVPAGTYRELVYAWAKAQFSDAELEQARREVRSENAYTTKEAIAYVEQLIRDQKGTK